MTEPQMYYMRVGIDKYLFRGKHLSQDRITAEKLLNNPEIYMTVINTSDLTVYKMGLRVVNPCHKDICDIRRSFVGRRYKVHNSPEMYLVENIELVPKDLVKIQQP